jgi:hypothetical protein
MKNLLYYCSGEVKTLPKKLEDTDKQLSHPILEVKPNA